MSDDTTPSNELEVHKLNHDESWELTDQIRQGYESMHENKMAQVERLARAYEGRAWESMGYDSFDEYHVEEFGEDLQHQRLELEERMGMVKALADSGMAKKKIAEILGIGRATVYRDLSEIEASVSPETSSQVDAAGQSVETAGHIDDDEPQSQSVPGGQQLVINFASKVEESIKQVDTQQDRFAGIDFAGMVLNPTPQQIIETQPSEETPDYFVPRRSEPSWSPPTVAELPPSPANAYDEPTDNSPVFLEAPMKLQKAGEANKKPEDKHCKTCACNLLP